MLTQLYASLVEESLAPLSYDATLAGLHYSLGTEHAGILLAISGYTEKLELLASTIFDKMQSLAPSQEEFSLVHDRLTRAYTNAKLSNPYSLADIELRRLTRQTFWTYDERLSALKEITAEDVVQHGQRLLEQTQLDMLVHGNFNNAVSEAHSFVPRRVLTGLCVQSVPRPLPRRSRIASSMTLPSRTRSTSTAV